MKFLVDTNILSEPAKPRPNPRVEEWIADHETDFYTSSLVVAELLNGLEKLADGERKRRLAQQIERLVEKLGGRILSFNLRVARGWVRLQTELRAKGHVMPWRTASSQRPPGTMGWCWRHITRATSCTQAHDFTTRSPTVDMPKPKLRRPDFPRCNLAVAPRGFSA